MKRPGCSAEGVLIVLVGLAAGTCSERNYAPGGDLQALSGGKVVRRENVSPDAIRASESTVNGRRAPRRWLRFTQTYADRALESVDSGRSFGLTSWLKHQ